jgi:hypothetical protein
VSHVREGEEKVSVSQVQLEMTLPFFLSSVASAVEERALSLVPAASCGKKSLLSGKDFILPLAVDRAENGDWSVDPSSCDFSTVEQVFALAEVEDQPARDLPSLGFADLQLEKRRYLDWLKREPRNGFSRRDELESWRRGGPQAEENFRLWWERKEGKRRTALRRKADRLANCGRCGRPMDCSRDPGHVFYGEYRCEMRYCKRCGEGIFSNLFSKYMGLWPIVRELVLSPGSSNVIAKLDFTARNLYRMPTPLEVRQFNQDVRLCVRRVTAALAIASDKFLFLWCDEFGGWRGDQRSPEALRQWSEQQVEVQSFNTNMHAHGVWIGPPIPYELLLQTWVGIRAKTDGARGVFIKRQAVDNSPADPSERERRRFTRALGHALKYTGKHHSRSDGKRLAELERVFHGVRRVHAMGLAYNADLCCREKCLLCDRRCDCSAGHEGQHSCKSHRASTGCPICAAPLMYPRDCGYRLVTDLKREGRRSLEEVKRQIAREQVFAGPRGSPAAGVA